MGAVGIKVWIYFGEMPGQPTPNPALRAPLVLVVPVRGAVNACSKACIADRKVQRGSMKGQAKAYPAVFWFLGIQQSGAHWITTGQIELLVLLSPVR